MSYVAPIIMGVSALVQGGIAMIAAGKEAEAQRFQGAYQREIYEANARFAELSAKDAITRGDRAVTQLQTQTAGLIGSQRASLAGQGIDVNVGSAADIQADTAGLSALDQLTIKNNAWREAWGIRVQAMGLRQQGALAEIAGNQAARNTALTGLFRGVGAIGQAASAADRIGDIYAGRGGGGVDNSFSKSIGSYKLSGRYF